MRLTLFSILICFFVSCKNGADNSPVPEKEKVQEVAEKEKETENSDLIVVTNPLPQAEIKSPLEVRGKARGYWFFEANAPVKILDKDFNKIAESYIKAEGNWMTKDPVNFTGSINFEAPNGEPGYLVFERANPSGRKENGGQYRIPVMFSSN